MSERPRSISKLLSPNDVGESRTHQSGVLVPRRGDILSFFPALSTEVMNPRMAMTFTDEEGRDWDFNFIYYNNKLFGRGTRNEYRLTGMTAYFRCSGAKSGDTLVLERLDDGSYTIRLELEHKTDFAVDEETHRVTLKLGSSWKVVSI